MHKSASRVLPLIPSCPRCCSTVSSLMAVSRHIAQSFNDLIVSITCLGLDKVVAFSVVPKWSAPVFSHLCAQLFNSFRGLLAHREELAGCKINSVTSPRSQGVFGRRDPCLGFLPILIMFITAPLFSNLFAMVNWCWARPGVAGTAGLSSLFLAHRWHLHDRRLLGECRKRMPLSFSNHMHTKHLSTSVCSDLSILEATFALWSRFLSA